MVSQRCSQVENRYTHNLVRSLGRVRERTERWDDRRYYRQHRRRGWGQKASKISIENPGTKAGDRQKVLQANGLQGCAFLHWCYFSFLRRRQIPFLDFSTLLCTRTGTLVGSDSSLKRSRVRATATFNSFMANCFPMQFLGQAETAKQDLASDLFLVNQALAQEPRSELGIRVLPHGPRLTPDF